MQPGDKTCPYCAEVIKAEAIRCKHCHADLAASRPRAKSEMSAPKAGKKYQSTALVVIGSMLVILLGVVVALGILGGTPSAKEKAQARDAIQLCHQQHEAYQGSSGAQEIIKGACTRLENDFREKFGYTP